MDRLYRRWVIKTAREYARIKIDGLRLVGGTFTNAPAHGDARFYNRARSRGIAPPTPRRPQTRIDHRQWGAPGFGSGYSGAASKILCAKNRSGGVSRPNLISHKV